MIPDHIEVAWEDHRPHSTLPRIVFVSFADIPARLTIINLDEAAAVALADELAAAVRTSIRQLAARRAGVSQGA